MCDFSLPQPFELNLHFSGLLRTKTAVVLCRHFGTSG